VTGVQTCALPIYSLCKGSTHFSTVYVLSHFTVVAMAEVTQTGSHQTAVKICVLVEYLS
jgi:hypothetical protein